MMAAEPDLQPPRSPHGAGRDAQSWLFMRVSGVALVLLVFGHLFVMDFLDGGVDRVNFAFVAARWSAPLWQVWDLLMLWLALLHGAIGMRTVIDDYARRDGVRLLLTSLLWSATTVAIALGTLVIFTFDPTL